MSLEQELAKNTAAIEALTAALAGGSLKSTGGADADAGTSKTTTAAKGKTTTAAKGKKAEVVDAETLKAKLVEYKGLTDLKTAKALVAKHGFDSIADVTEDKSKEVFDAIQAAIVALDDGNNADAGEEEEL